MRTPAHELAVKGAGPLPSRLNPALPALGVASVLAAGTSAYGQVIYTNLGAGTAVSTSSFSPNVDGLGGTDLTITNNFPTGAGNHLRLTAGQIAGSGEGNYTIKISAGTTIGAGQGLSFFTSGDRTVIEDTNSAYFTRVNAPWGNVSTAGPIRGYVGFSFISGAVTHYGWLDLEVVGGGNVSAKVFGYAYESSFVGAVGNSIQAGAIPEPSTAALLIGAASLLALRQRRRMAA